LRELMPTEGRVWPPVASNKKRISAMPHIATIFEHQKAMQTLAAALYVSRPLMGLALPLSGG